MADWIYAIDTRVFERFPGYTRGVVLAFGVANSPSPSGLVAELRAAEEELRGRISLDTIAEHPRIKSWREAYRAFGTRPSEFRSSIEALARRALRGELLPSINALVDIGTLLSLRHLAPVGGHAIDVLAGNIALRPANGNEVFIPMGGGEPETPLPGEIIFTEGDRILTRRWTWRQSNHTLTELTTREIEFNVDALPPVHESEVEAICQEVATLVAQFCGGQCRYEVLNVSHPAMKLGL